MNDITRKDSFPLPRIDCTLDALNGASWFSTLDLASGYWQVEVRPADRMKTAFVIPSGLYEFETMPFGLTNAPATFQRLMQTVLQGLVPKNCLIYLDDIIVHAPTVDEHNRRLQEVFDRLRNAGLKLKMSKCSFLQREVSFLGHVITPAGIKTDGSKIQKIRDWPKPRSTDEVRSFMGLASYYRKFVPKFAAIATPLHRLTEKGRRFLWTAECERAFGLLKHHLSSPPILAYPDVSQTAGEFVLDTDASDLAIGAVLSQKTDKGEAVIAYASRCLSKCERRYSTTRREMLALVAFLKHFRPYLLGRPFTVRTDHQSLQWLRSFKEPQGQVARWQECLQEYDFVCIYRPGRQHTNADALSRRPSDQVVNALLVDPVAEESWASAQRNDPYISNIYLRQLEGSKKPTGREMNGKSQNERSLWSKWSDLEILNSVLHLVSRDVPVRHPKLIVPLAKVTKVISTVHAQLGHCGQRKTEAAIRQRFWWPRIHEDVITFCTNCENCARIKAPVQTPRAQLQSIPPERPNHRVGVDVIGPLPVSRSGNRFILVMVDYFTKWCEAFPMKNQEAATISHLIVNEWIARYGVPVSLHSDQGAPFESHLLAEICHLLGVHKTRTTPYHPQSNGLVERTNRTIKGLLRSFVDRYQNDKWDEFLPQCLMAYRASIHATTGYSPAFLMHGKEIRLPVEILTPLASAETSSLMDYTKNLRDRLHFAYKNAAEHHSSAQQKQKYYYDRRANGPSYEVGDQVMLHRPKPGPGMCAKFHQPWQGPYTVVMIRSPTVFVIRNMRSPKSDVLTVHYNQLKPAPDLNKPMPCPSVLPPGCVPIPETTVEVPVEGGDAVGTEDSATLGGR